METEEDVKGLGDYLAILKRRRWQLILPAALLVTAAAVAAVAIPATYRSQATILIEQQEIPQELVRSTVTSYADQRVQVISKRILTTAKLGEIVERFGLYRDKREHTGIATVVEDMRKDDIHLNMISAEVVDPRSGRPAQATIAFTLAYDNPNPQVAQKVASEIVTLFLNENLKTRREAARQTSRFLNAEAEKLSTQISTLEAKLATFKEQHNENLPELSQYNLQLLQRTEDQMRSNENILRTLDERKIYLQAQLAQIDPYSGGYSSGGQRVLGSADRLRLLEGEHAGVVARYSPDHPTRIQLEREMGALRAQLGSPGNAVRRDKLAEQQAELATLRQRYGADHPDVKKAERAVAATEKQLAAAGKQAPTGTGGGSTDADNPAYVQLYTQLQAAESQQRALAAEQEQLKAKRAEIDQRITEAPMIEREYRELARDYENATTKYREVRAKQLQADLGESLEAESKGERFSLIEPPQQPEKPEKPNRLAILFLGVVFALGGGIGNVALQESLDGSVRGARGVVAIAGEPPLAVIPRIITPQELAARRLRRMWLAVGAVVLVLGLLLAVHLLFGPLDVLWYSLLNRFGLLDASAAG